MTILDPKNSFELLSVLELDLPSQDIVIPPRPFHVMSLRFKGDAVMAMPSLELSFQDNDLYYCPSGCSYHIRSGAEHLVLINFKCSHNDASRLEQFRPVNPVPFQNAFRSLLEVWTAKEPGYYYRAMSIFYKILEAIEQQSAPINTKLFMQSLKKSIDYLHQHYTDPTLTVSDLCNIANISGTLFRKKFHAIYGQAPLAYLNRLRVGHAADLLAHTPSSVEEIAQLSGFSDPKYFSTVFKKYMGSSPAKYRQTN